jgi:hypothetical protein
MRLSDYASFEATALKQCNARHIATIHALPALGLSARSRIEGGGSSWIFGMFRIETARIKGVQRRTLTSGVNRPIKECE